MLLAVSLPRSGLVQHPLAPFKYHRPEKQKARGRVYSVSIISTPLTFRHQDPSQQNKSRFLQHTADESGFQFISMTPAAPDIASPGTPFH
jgi:hypothetical protein